MADAPPTTAVLIGKTGSGKSSLANALYGDFEFKVGCGFDSETKDCQGRMKVTRGRLLILVDTPGTMDVKDPTMPEKELLNALNNCPNGVDAFFIVLRADSRFTDEEYRAIQQSVDVFGPQSHKRAIVIFSHGGKFKKDVNKFKEILDKGRASIPGLNELLNKFGNRYVLMDNGDECDEEFKERQVAALLSLVDEVSKHNPQKYSQKDLDAQTKKQKAKKKEAERKQQQKDEETTQMRIQMAQMKAEADCMRREMDNSRRSAMDQVQQCRRGYGPVTQLLSDTGSAVGAVVTSPIAGAASMLNWALS